LRNTFGCLAHALAFIHNKNVKHIDIKPKDLLIRAQRNGLSTYKIYIVDFGIARSYRSAIEAETDSPIPFTRTYVAPEVVLQDTRGFSADLFSLGCVFIEMMATLMSAPSCNECHCLSDVRTSTSRDSSYHANLDTIRGWYLYVFGKDSREGLLSEELLGLVPGITEHMPECRLSAAELNHNLRGLCCFECDAGPEPFEVVENLP
jgi:serine/threonine protein kinase